jgi:A/G-specific adenine glycosylase
MPDPIACERFAAQVISWQIKHGRHDLPWQHGRDPYAIWISEVMLQQTQVATVIAYYRRFLQRFPDVVSLASASLDDVLRLWSGLGYYSRARNLHAAAVTIVSEHGGRFPRDPYALAQLAGIGRSTAAAIAALAFGEPCAILDGNVKRVLCRCFAIDGDPSSGPVQRSLWKLAERLVPAKAADLYTQGMMDLGATVCTRQRPQCALCPLASDCVASRTDRTDMLPRARARAPLPERAVAMLLLRHGEHVLLERRPAHGIWGGLWSLPEADVGDDVREHCVRRFGVRAGAVQALPGVRHAFTHYKLSIRPWRIEVRSLGPCVTEGAIAWLSREDAVRAALPSPVRRILEAHEA